MSQTITLEFEQVGLDGITKEAEQAAKGIESLQKQSNSFNFKSLQTATKSAISSLKGVSSQVSSVGKTLSTGITQGATKAVAGFKTLSSGVGEAMKGVMTALGPVSLAIMAIPQAVELCKKAFESLSNVKGIAFADDMQSLKESIQKVIGFVTKLVAAFASPFVASFSKSLKSITETFKNTAVIDKFANAIGMVQAVVSEVWDIFSGWIGDIKDAVMPTIEAFTNVVKKLDERFGLVTKTIGIVKNSIDYFINNLSNALEIITKLLQGDFAGAWEGVKTYISEGVTGVVEVFTKAEETGSQIMNRVKDKASKNSKDVKEILTKANIETEQSAREESGLTLQQQLDNLNKWLEFEKSVVVATEQNAEERARKLKELDQGYYSAKLSLEKDAMKTILENNGKITDKSIKSQEDLKKQIEDTTVALQGFNEEGVKIDETTEKVDNLHQHLTSMTNSLSGLGSSVMGVWSNIVQSATVDLREYERAIEEAQAKYDAMMEEYNAKVAAIEEERKAKEEDERETKIANLEEEMQRSIEANDTMSAKAIKIKLDQLKKEKKADEEKAKVDEELANEKARIEAEGQYAIALATYNKDMASWDANVKKAEQQKNAAIADTALQTATAIANAAMMPLQPGWAAMGPIGIAAASIAAAASLGAALSSIGGIVSASNQLDSVKSEQPVAPTPPAFAYGTGGYKLGSDYAVVGEMGPELVRNKGNGNLEVVSTEQTKSRGVGTGDTFNLSINVNEMVTEEQVLGFVRNMKSRNLSFAV